jgi:hypothetical protein
MPTPISQIEVIDDAMAEILRQKTPAERLAIADGMWRFAREMIRATIAKENPDWTTEQVNRMVARRLSHGAV